MKITNVILGICLLLIFSISVFSQDTETNSDSKKDDSKTGNKIVSETGNSGKDKKNSPVKILSKPMPKYTELARKNNTQGRIVLEVTFMENRKIGEIKVIEGLPNGLNEKAIKAAKGIKFKPEIKNGELQTVTKRMEYNFTIF